MCSSVSKKFGKTISYCNVNLFLKDLVKPFFTTSMFSNYLKKRKTDVDYNEDISKVNEKLIRKDTFDCNHYNFDDIVKY